MYQLSFHLHIAGAGLVIECGAVAFIHAPVAYEPGGIGGLGQLTLSVELVHILGGVPQCQVAHAPYCACAANGELAFDREGGNRGCLSGC